MSEMKTRFFYAPHSYNTWPKLFVLTEDGRLYCEYLNYNSFAVIEKQVDFNTFQAEDYSFEGYQDMEEVDEEIAVKTRLINQDNWVRNYLDSI